MKASHLIVIGASAGGVEALQEVLRGLPPDLDAAVLMVLHTSGGAGRVLGEILQRQARLPIQYPEDRTEIEEGMVYLAPPDFHMTVEDGHLRVLQGPRENRTRPAIDPLFRTAARYYRDRVTGVILTGLLDDGSLGLMAVRSRGGEAIVQDPASADFSSMPASALQHAPDAMVLPLAEIPDALVRRTRELRGAASPPRIPAATPPDAKDEEHRRGRPSAYACPDCGGVLWEIEDEGRVHYRCRVGHAFTVPHLEREQRHAVETALWSALRALEESASLYRRMAERASSANQGLSAEHYSHHAANTESNARVLKGFLLQVNREVDEDEDAEEAVAAESGKQPT